MVKLEDRWMKRVFGEPGAVEARDIPYDSNDSIGDRLRMLCRVPDPANKTATYFAFYVSPDGTGDGLTSGNPTNLEALRQRFIKMTNVSLELHLTAGEHVLQGPFKAGAGSTIVINGDYSTWATNPTVISSQGASGSNIDTSYSGYAGAAAHTNTSEPFSLFVAEEPGAYIQINDAVLNNNYTVALAAYGGVIRLSRYRVNLWSNDNATYNYAVTVTRGGLVIVDTRTLYDSSGNVLKSAASDYSDNYGIFVYESQANLDGTVSNTQRAVTVYNPDSIFMLDSGYHNALFYGRSGYLIPFIQQWQQSQIYTYAHVKVLGYKNFLKATQRAEAFLSTLWLNQVYDEANPVDGQVKFLDSCISGVGGVSIMAPAVVLESDLYFNGHSYMFVADNLSTITCSNLMGNGHAIRTVDAGGMGQAFFSNALSRMKISLNNVNIVNDATTTGTYIRAAMGVADIASDLKVGQVSSASVSFTNTGTNGGYCALVYANEGSRAIMDQNLHALTISTPSGNLRSGAAENGSFATRTTEAGDRITYTNY